MRQANKTIDPVGEVKDEIREFFRKAFHESIEELGSEAIVDNFMMYVAGRSADSIYQNVIYALGLSNRIFDADQERELKRLTTKYAQAADKEFGLTRSNSIIGDSPNITSQVTENVRKNSVLSKFKMSRMSFSTSISRSSYVSSNSYTSSNKDDSKLDIRSKFESFATEKLLEISTHKDTTPIVNNKVEEILVEHTINLREFSDLVKELDGMVENYQPLSIDKERLNLFYLDALDLYIDTETKPVIQEMLKFICSPKADKNNDSYEKSLIEEASQIVNSPAPEYKQKIIAAYVLEVEKLGLNLNKGGAKPTFGPDNRDNLPYRGFKALCRTIGLDHKAEYAKTVYAKLKPSAPTPKSFIKFVSSTLQRSSPS